MLELKNIYFSYKTIFSHRKSPVLKNFNFSFESNKIYALTAPNGFGKTTLMKIIAGYLIPDSGEIIIDGIESDFKRYPYEKFSLFYNPDRMFYWQISAISNLLFFKTVRKEIYDKNRLKDIAHNFNITDEMLDKKFGELSSGNRSKIALTGVMAGGRNFLLLDEPFTSLDTKSSDSLKMILKDISENATVIVTTARKDYAKELADTNVDLERI
jgi:ABC-2 type transport system ATP-binding protein